MLMSLCINKTWYPKDNKASSKWMESWAPSSTILSPLSPNTRTIRAHHHRIWPLAPAKQLINAFFTKQCLELSFLFTFCDSCRSGFNWMYLSASGIEKVAGDNQRKLSTDNCLLRFSVPEAEFQRLLSPPNLSLFPSEKVCLIGYCTWKEIS